MVALLDCVLVMPEPTPAAVPPVELCAIAAADVMSSKAPSILVCFTAVPFMFWKSCKRAAAQQVCLAQKFLAPGALQNDFRGLLVLASLLLAIVTR